ncbi:MAG: hypothetical protein ACK5A2_09410 [Bacteroidota bacterium]|jgi:hypothetical protein|nr:hypothetical protein [Chitinophagaceae bacterium]
MADNVGYTPGSGEVIATDDIGGVQFQRVKPVWGVDGVAQDVNNNTPLPVTGAQELMEAIEAMRMAIHALTRTIGLAQVNPLTGRMLVDPSGVTSPVSGTVTANQGGTWNITNLATIGGVAANSQVQSFERMTADNLRRNITVT